MEPEQTLPPLTLSQAIQDFVATRSLRLSPHTLVDYGRTYRRFQDFLVGDPPFLNITYREIAGFLHSFPELSGKSLLNMHAGLAALWSWAIRNDICQSNIVHRIERPAFEKRQIIPFTRAEVTAMLEAVGVRSRVYARPGKRACTNGPINARRNHAMVICMLDTGLRAGELCGLKVKGYANEQLLVLGKGRKERSLPVSKITHNSIMDYLDHDHPDPTLNQPLFLSKHGGALTRYALGDLIRTLGTRVGIYKAHPHRFRHTFAINFLRNGGDIYSLQRMLGHTTLKMVENYLAIAQEDVIAAHGRASPVKAWFEN